MKLKNLVFEKVQNSHKKVLVVTKYYDRSETNSLINKCEQNFKSCLYGFGENRIESLEEKQLPRVKVHFIGNLQSKKLRKIVQYSTTIHGLDSLKHAQRLNQIIKELSLAPLKVFIQIKLDSEKKTGVLPRDLPTFMEHLKPLDNLNLVGISGMGTADFTESEKRSEFQLLLDLRNKYLPKGCISAGTSRDYAIALYMGIDIVRVGRAIVSLD